MLIATIIAEEDRQKVINSVLDRSGYYITEQHDVDTAIGNYY